MAHRYCETHRILVRFISRTAAISSTQSTQISPSTCSSSHHRDSLQSHIALLATRTDIASKLPDPPPSCKTSCAFPVVLLRVEQLQILTLVLDVRSAPSRHCFAPVQIFDLSCDLQQRYAENMFQLRKTFTFEASHRLLHHDGKCANLHGHSYRLTVELSGDQLQKVGAETNMLIDFQHVSHAVKKLVNSHLDHRHLNESLDTDSPTAEYIAWWIYERLKSSIPFLTAVTINETETSSATYRPTAHCHGCICSRIGEQEKPFVAPIANSADSTSYIPKTNEVQNRDGIVGAK